MTFWEQLRESRGRRLLIGGHRGHLSETRENTIENYREVLGSGISHIEVDLQLTKDGVAVIYHDFELADRTSLKGRIRDYTLAELRAAFRIDTFEETIAWCRENRQPAALELKCRPIDMSEDMPEIARQVAEVLAKYDFFEESFVFGTDFRTLRRIKELDPRVHLALIVPFVPADPVKLMEEMQAEIYLVYLETLCPEIVERLHAAGYYVDGSVVNDRERLKLALELGVDLIESDHPAEMLALYDALREESR